MTPSEPTIRVARVFPLKEAGGNPAPIVLDAAGMTDEAMRRVAEASGHESGFVLPPSPGSGADLRLRFFVPRHEMEMCGHATIAALWLLREAGRLPKPELTIETLSGLVRARAPAAGPIAISQPAGRIDALSEDETALALGALRLSSEALVRPHALNAATSRTKTLLAIRSVEELHALAPDLDRMEAVCEAIGSTGLYPFAAGAEPGCFHARQFPRASGYPEDAATGIAAAALAYGAVHWGMAAGAAAIRVRQGEAMGRPSEIAVRFEDGDPAQGCWLAGVCAVEAGA